jgi:hypothetical protein
MPDGNANRYYTAVYKLVLRLQSDDFIPIDAHHRDISRSRRIIFLPIGRDGEIGRIGVVREQRDWSCTKYSRQRRHVQGRFAAKNAPAGQRQIRTISARRIRAGHWDDYLPAPASASGSGKRRPGEVQVSAACCADLFWTDRGSLPLLTPWPWYRPAPVAAVPIQPCPATRGRRA